MPEKAAAEIPVETRVIYQVTRADGTVEDPVVGEWEATTMPASDAHSLLGPPPGTSRLRRLLFHIKKRVV